jgi:saxitoxin biosynthesis operon SxtJ-like protein
MTGASPSPAALRKFGLSVGGVFLLLGAVSRWRGHTIAPALLATAGVLLVVPGLVAPAVLAPVERRWMQFAEVLGRINTRIVLTVLYYVVITPVGALRRRSADPLDRRMREPKPSNWVRRERGPVDPARYRHQF